MASLSDKYDGREQTLIKHKILSRYLSVLFRIIGLSRRYDSLTYVDCFCGPWGVRDPELRDTSFAIAINELRSARTFLADQGIEVKPRCLLLEKRPRRYRRLSQYCDQVSDIPVQPLKGKFLSSVPSILKFVREGGHRNFTFYFIDPTGWSDIPVSSLAPLLLRNNSEALITLMSSFLNRFIDERIAARLLEDASIAAKIRSKHGEERSDFVAGEYCRSLRQRSPHLYISPTVVPNPVRSRVHFHMIYASGSLKGVQAFKEAERRVVDDIRTIRTGILQSARISKSGNLELFTPAQCSERDRYLDQLRERYSEMAFRTVDKCLSSGNAVKYDDLFKVVARFPFVSESDLKNWIAAHAENLALNGLRPSEKVPKLFRNITVRRIKKTLEKPKQPHALGRAAQS